MIVMTLLSDNDWFVVASFIMNDNYATTSYSLSFITTHYFLNLSLHANNNIV